ncbi:MAG: sugar phosphate isomerase/epimerase, partial [Bacteroidota bacterium]
MATPSLFFKISLAEWSLHKALQAGQLTNLDFPAKAKNDFGISAVEYVNQFFQDKAKDTAYLTELKKRCDDLGVT